MITVNTTKGKLRVDKSIHIHGPKENHDLSSVPPHIVFIEIIRSRDTLSPTITGENSHRIEIDVVIILKTKIKST